jgi:hypothetical protein
MTDYCLKMTDEAAFDTLMVRTGLCVLMTSEENFEQVVPVSPAVLIDKIGPITIGDVVYPEYYANLRLLDGATEQQAEALAPYSIDPSQPQYRVWA